MRDGHKRWPRKMATRDGLEMARNGGPQLRATIEAKGPIRCSAVHTPDTLTRHVGKGEGRTDVHPASGCAERTPNPMLALA